MPRHCHGRRSGGCSWSVLACLLWLTAGCGDDDPPADAGALAPSLAIGTGGLDVFTPVSDGDVLQLARGCQGSQHVWVSLRVERLDAERTIVEMWLQRVRDEQLAAAPFTVRLGFVAKDGYAERTGMQLQVAEPEKALGEELKLIVRVTDRAGLSAESQRRVRVEWGSETCGADQDGGLDGGPGDAGTDAASGSDAGTDATAAADSGT